MLHHTQKKGLGLLENTAFEYSYFVQPRNVGHVWNRIYITWESMTDSLRIESSVGGSRFCMMGP